MFWKKRPVEEPTKPEAEKLPGPKDISQLIGGPVVTTLKPNPDWFWKLKQVTHPRLDSKDAFDFRIFDPAQAKAKKIDIKNYNSLDEYPDLIFCQGWVDKRDNKVHIEEEKMA